jgi:Gpi18-like mannosyltransferase
MFRGKSLILLITLCLIIRIITLVISLNNPHFAIIQDNYLDYSKEVINGTINNINNVNSRLLPGYPLLILTVSFLTSMPPIVSGLFISIVSSILCVTIFNNIFKNKIAVMLYSLFPPVWILSSVKIATEPLTAMLLLFSIFLFLKKKYFLAGLVTGFATGVRFISVCLLAAFIVTLIRKHKRKILPLFSGFAIPIFLFLIYNLIVFGNIFHQILLYPRIGGASGSSIGILQLISDFPRSLDWHQYRIFLSGSFYIVFSIIGCLFLYKYRNNSDVFKISFYWLLFSLIFILSYGPSPLLEEFSRFIIPCLPAIIIGITAPFKKYE